MRLLAPVFLALVLASGVWAQVSVGGPTEVQNPAYSLRVRILTRNESRGPYGMRTWGRADLFSPQEQGFDYDCTCSEVLMATIGEQRYSARWKTPNKELELLVSRVGTDKSSKCTVKANLQPFIYEYHDGVHTPVITQPLPQP
jgi:hypothetical protein